MNSTVQNFVQQIFMIFADLITHMKIFTASLCEFHDLWTDAASAGDQEEVY